MTSDQLSLGFFGPTGTDGSHMPVGRGGSCAGSGAHSPAVRDARPFSQAILQNADHDKFDGADYVPSRDDVRLTGQLERVFNLMADGKWRTLRQIAEGTGDPEASISAQMRNLRKARFGGHTVNKTYQSDGLYVYQLFVKTDTKS